MLKTLKFINGNISNIEEEEQQEENQSEDAEIALKLLSFIVARFLLTLERVYA